MYDVEYDENFGKVTIYMVNAKGRTHRELFKIMSEDGSMIDSACNRLSYFAKIALNLGNSDISEIDHKELINKYIGAKVEHTTMPHKDDPEKTVTFVNLTDKWVADGFDTEPCEKALTMGNATKPVGKVDLSSLLD